MEKSAPSFSENIGTDLHEILLKTGDPTYSTHNDARKQILEGIGLDNLQEARRSLFQFAKSKHAGRLQDGDDSVQGMGTSDQLILKSRRSVEAVIDDILELYLYLTDDRNKFPRACLSSSKLKTVNVESTTCQETKDTGNSTKTPQHITAKNAPEIHPNPEIMDLKFAIDELRSEIKSMKAHFVENSDLRSQVNALENERKSLQTAIEMLTSEKSTRPNSSTTAPSSSLPKTINDKDYSSPEQPHLWTSVKNKRQTQKERPSTSTVKLTPPETIVTPVANRFAALTDQAGMEFQEPSPEEVIDQYYNELIDRSKKASSTSENKQASATVNSGTTGVSFKQQMEEYRTKQTMKFKDRPSKSVTLLGDSMVKRIQGHKLSQSKSVTVISRPGATIEDLSAMITDGSVLPVLQTTELIVHVGTNNTRDDAETISKKLESLCEMAQGKYAINDITISSIIHRSPANKREHDKIVSANTLIRQICFLHSWKFINNDNINQRLLAYDGVHLGGFGITVFARNFIRHLRGLPPVTSTHANMFADSDDHDRPMRCSLHSLQSRRSSSVIQGRDGQPSPTYAKATSTRLPANDDSNVPVPRHQDFRHQDWKTRKRHSTPSQQCRKRNLAPAAAPLHTFQPTVHRVPLPSQEEEWHMYQRAMRHNTYKW